MRKKKFNGEVFEQLTVLDCDRGFFIGSTGRRATKVLVRCSCGTEKEVRLNDLRSGKIVSCGCKPKRKRHGMKGTRIYAIWQGMKDRCNNPKNKQYKNYGGRGISVCSGWNIFENFHEWALAADYSEALTIDRINNDGNYEPHNCRWADTVTQANNKRVRADNKTGFPGVTLHRLTGKFQAAYSFNRKRFYVGLFHTPEEAHRAIVAHRKA